MKGKVLDHEVAVDIIDRIGPVGLLGVILEIPENPPAVGDRTWSAVRNLHLQEVVFDAIRETHIVVIKLLVRVHSKITQTFKIRKTDTKAC